MATPILEFTARERELVFAVAMKYVKDRDAAEDVAQDALLQAYRYRDSFRGDSRVSTWLYRIAATTALMHLRKQRRVPLLRPLDELTDPDAASGAEPAAPGPSPEQRAADREAIGVADARLHLLGDKYADIFTLHFALGCTETEIARRTRLNLSTIKTRAARARAALAAELARRAA